MAMEYRLLLQKQLTWTSKLARIFFVIYLPLPGCVALPQMGSENMVMVRLLQIGAKDLTVRHVSVLKNVFWLLQASCSSKCHQINIGGSFKLLLNKNCPFFTGTLYVLN